MSLPEISRRCRSCGAAVRAGARFCPQCGKVMEAATGDEGARAGGARDEGGAGAARAESEGGDVLEPDAREHEAPAAPAGRGPEAAREWAPPTKEFSAFVGSAGGGAARDDGAAGERAEPATGAGSSDLTGDGLGAAGRQAEAGAGAEGAAGVAAAGETRGHVARVREGTRARVERMREEALVVLEEAPDDSGLRFVLTAAALFVVFLLLLFLSTTVLR